MTEVGCGFQQTIKFLLHHFIFLFWNLGDKRTDLLLNKKLIMKRKNRAPESSEPEMRQSRSTEKTLRATRAVTQVTFSTAVWIPKLKTPPVPEWEEWKSRGTDKFLEQYSKKRCHMPWTRATLQEHNKNRSKKFNTLCSLHRSNTKVCSTQSHFARMSGQRATIRAGKSQRQPTHGHTKISLLECASIKAPETCQWDKRLLWW